MVLLPPAWLLCYSYREAAALHALHHSQRKALVMQLLHHIIIAPFPGYIPQLNSSFKGHMAATHELIVGWLTGQSSCLLANNFWMLGGLQRIPLDFLASYWQPSHQLSPPLSSSLYRKQASKQDKRTRSTGLSPKSFLSSFAYTYFSALRMCKLCLKRNKKHKELHFCHFSRKAQEKQIETRHQ